MYKERSLAGQDTIPMQEGIITGTR
jgi:hypothetical protein